MLGDEIPQQELPGWDLSQKIPSHLKFWGTLKPNSWEALAELFQVFQGLPQISLCLLGVSFSSGGSRGSHGNAQPALAERRSLSIP